MKCPICKKGETYEGVTTVTLERDRLTLVVKAVPAEVCENCGEAYVKESAAVQLLQEAEASARSGSEINVRHFQMV